MSDNIPFEIQMEIIKKVPDVKSLIRFRAVSKAWKSFIDSSDFIAGHAARDTQPHSLLLRYKDCNSNEDKYVCFIDDDDENEILTQQQYFAPNVVPDLMKQINDLIVIRSSHGLLCLHSFDKDMLILWNPCIRKAVRIELPFVSGRFIFLGFMVCPVNNDPTIVMISYPCQIGIFTMSSKRCTVFQYSKLPPKYLLQVMSSQVVIDTCIYWLACEIIPSIYDGTYRYCFMIVSFDFIAKEIRLVDIPCSSVLNNPYPKRFFISKLRGSLVLFAPIEEEVEIPVCGVWKMEHDESFSKLFTISTPDYTINNILGFRNNGELVMETEKEDEQFVALKLYNPCSEHVNNLGISGKKHSFFMGSYKETLLLLDCCVCSDIN